MSSYSGPSPHAWGKRGQGKGWYRFLRTIPTCVGKTTNPTPAETNQTDHPHMRGENLPGTPATSASNGPSPHAWEKHQLAQQERKALRTIPTCVGKTACAFCTGCAEADHPHMRGENIPVALRDVPHHGPSPHAWGKLFPSADISLGIRTIPTCVGKTPMQSPSPTHRPDHPHMRGENSLPFPW